MKKIGLVFCLVLFFSISFQVSAQWYWENPRPTGNTLNSVKFINETTAWFVGDGGQIFKTTDSGFNWFIQPCGTYLNLNSVYFLDELTGWAVGDSGLILKTINGGESWNVQISGTKLILSSIQFIDPNIGWIAGYNGVTSEEGIILKTTNGGEIWDIQLSGNIKNVYSICFINEDLGWSVGLNNIKHTTDGGNSWHSVYFTEQLPNFIFFTNPDTGWIAGLEGIYKTTNGGINWNLNFITSPQYASCIQFINDYVGWAVGGRYPSRFIIKTTDGGETWFYQKNETNDLAFTSVHFQDSNNGLVVGALGQISKTTDGGTTWIQSDFEYDFYYDLNSVCFPNKDTGWVCNLKGAFKTTNGGLNWNFQQFSNAYSIFFIDTQTGWMVGLGGNIYKTTNGGLTWEHPIIGQGGSLYCVYFNTSNYGWAIGDIWDIPTQKSYGIICKTIDGGDNWEKYYTRTNEVLRSVYFVDQNYGWIVGGNSGGDPIILNSTDGGNSWQYQESGINNNLYDCYFTDQQTGFAVGELGTILKTTDGGINWEANSIENCDIYAIDFVNPDVGWLIGKNYRSTYGVILKTTDRGDNWTFQPISTNYDLNSLFFLDENNGWFVGRGVGTGMVLKYGDTPTLVGNNRDNSSPKIHWLSQNYPNPFNPSTKISWQSPVSGWQTLRVYDILGNEVATLVDEYRNAGSYNAQFTINNVQLSSGVYFYQLRVGDFVETKKMILLK